MNYANQNWLAAFLCFLISFLQDCFTYITKAKDSSARERWNDFLKKEKKVTFWSYKYKRKFTLKSWFKWKKVENYRLKKLKKIIIKTIYNNG